MANDRSHGIAILCWYIVIIARVLQMRCHGHPEVKFSGLRKDLGQMPEGTQKTIETDYGDIIDCVDIYKQPSLRDIPREAIKLELREEDNENDEFWQDWHRFGECPLGTIPILRDKIPISSHVLRKAPPPVLRKKQYNHSLAWWDPAENHEYAMVTTGDGVYFGTQAVFSVWSPEVESSEFSLAQTWISAENPRWHSFDAIEIGWMVYPKLFGDIRTRIFTYWSTGSYASGCYNLRCKGFVQTNSKCTIGGFIRPLSTIGGDQYDINITVFKAVEGDGHWWLKINGNIIGYWPKTLFTNLRDFAGTLAWGGEIVNKKPNSKHTTTQMGSGRFGSEGPLRAAFIENIKESDAYGSSTPGYVYSHISKPGCYDVSSKSGLPDDLGSGFYYGGPGYSADKCPK